MITCFPTCDCGWQDKPGTAKKETTFKRSTNEKQSLLLR